MKKFFLIFISFNFLLISFIMGQDRKYEEKTTRDIYELIDNYSMARNKKDTVLLKSILTNDIDQMTSGGELRKGIGEAVKGMLRSSENNPGSRTLTVENLRIFDSNNALADARYEILNTQGSTQRMWSTFVVVNHNGKWKIAAIRNMLPTNQR